MSEGLYSCEVYFMCETVRSAKMRWNKNNTDRN